MSNKTPDGIHNYATEIDKIEIKEKIYKVFMYQGTFYIKLPKCIVNGKTLKETRKRVLAKLSRNKVRLNIPGMMYFRLGGGEDRKQPKFTKITIKGIHGTTGKLEIKDHLTGKTYQEGSWRDTIFLRVLSKEAKVYYAKLKNAQYKINEKIEKFEDKYSFNGFHEAKESIKKILEAQGNAE